MYPEYRQKLKSMPIPPKPAAPRRSKSMAIADVAIRHRQVLPHWIGGKPVAFHIRTCTARSGIRRRARFAREVDFASAAEVDHAVEAAKRAFPEWRATPLSRRAEIMFKLRELVDANRRSIAELITLEHGKTLPDAMGEVARGLENIEFACGIPQLC